MAARQGSVRHEVFLIDSKIAIFADDSKLYKIISKTSDKISLQQDHSALQVESHLRNEPWHTKVQDPKHLQQKIAVKQRIPHIDGTRLTTAICSETIDLGITIMYRQPSVVSTHKSDLPKSKLYCS